MTTLDALTGAPGTAYLSAIRLRDHVLPFVSVSPLTFRDSLTGRNEILFSSQLLKNILVIIPANSVFCQSLFVSHMATITALMPPVSLPMIIGPIISGAKPAVKPR